MQKSWTYCKKLWKGHDDELFIEQIKIDKIKLLKRRFVEVKMFKMQWA